MPPSPASSLADNLRGAAMITVGMLAFAINDTIMKSFAGQLDIGQLIVLRGLFAIVLVFAAAQWAGHMRPLREAFRPLMVLRSLGEVAATFFFLTALFHLPFANVSAILQALPLGLTLFAALLFGEKIGWRRLTAVVVGFIGVLIVVRPGAEGFTAYSLYAVASVVACVVRDLVTRRMGTGVPSLFISLVTAVFVTVMGFVIALFEPWRPVTAGDAGWLGLSALFVATGYYFTVAGIRIGDIAFVSPFRYSVLLFSIIAGMLAFGEYPDAATIIGAAIIVATGIYTLYRERVVHRRAIAPTDPI